MIWNRRYLLQKAKNLLWHLPKSLYFNLYYRRPASRLTLIGITGTDGKTTTSSLVYQVLINAGIKAGLVTTIGAKYNDQAIDTGLHLTSPDAAMIQRLLRQMADAGITHVVLETTSHALDQFRYFGCHFAVAGLTNTSHEHLDDFFTMDNYILAKSKLFTHAHNCLLNKDDPSYPLISSKIKPKKITTYSVNQPSKLQAKNIKISPKLLRFNVGPYQFITDTIYRYQIYNILLAFGICQKLKIPTQIFLDTIRHFPEIPGRRQELPNRYGFKTIIDFAHTPAALAQTLNSLKAKAITPGNLIAIFGATGGRDKSKRPLMGETVASIANIAIVTADDTRQENINQINQDIIEGFPATAQFADHVQLGPTALSQISLKAKKNFVYFNVPNRQDAFNLAVRLAQKGDTIIACGKGHETTILHGSTEYPWSETEAFRTAFRLKYGKI
jgi:UDP-N-acetylmuramoyl-L-alanyl-D-glutamate--2,6-diaminopimelate ligase